MSEINLETLKRLSKEDRLALLKSEENRKILLLSVTSKPVYTTPLKVTSELVK